MQRSGDEIESTNEVAETDHNILNLLDSLDTYLILMDSLSSALRQGWLDLASARHSMGSSRVSSVLFDLKSHHASTTLQVDHAGTNVELPSFALNKWQSSDDPEKCSEEAKFEEDELLKNKSDSPKVQHQSTSPGSELQERRAEVGGSPVTPDNQAQNERSKSLSMFGKLVSPKLRSTQLSFETALETLVELANSRASLLCAYDQVQKDLKTNK